MDQNLVYAKTPSGEDAIRQRTRVVQRNLRMVLIQVDGKTSVAELGDRIGNIQLVENALRELEEGGFIATVLQPPSVWERGKEVAKDIKEVAVSQFSTFGQRSRPPQSQIDPSYLSEASAFSDFGNPLMPPELPEEEPIKPSVGGRVAAVFSGSSQTSEEPARSWRFRPVILLQLLLGLLVLSCLGVVFYPYNDFKPDIEAALGQAFQAPVRIGNVSLGLLPRPALSLQGVKIGAQGEASADEIRVLSLFALLGRGQRQIPAIEISGLAIPADGLGILAGLGNDTTRQAPAFTIGHVRLQRMSVRMTDVALSGLEGEILFKGDGQLDKLRLQTEDRTLRIEAVPTPQGTVLNIEGLAWKPAEGLPYVFESMQAKGLLQPGRLVLNDIDTTFLGGVLKGSWLLNWRDGMAMAGEASLNRISVRRMAETMAPALKMDGELSGALRLRATGKDWQSMWANVEASLDADIVRGVLTGVDIGEAARRGAAGRGVRGGATKFDRLRGLVVVDPRQVTGRDIRLEAGLISANGRFVADRESKVVGSLDVSIGSSVSNVRVPIKVSGTLPNLDVMAGR